MTELHAGLELYREDLRRAIGREVSGQSGRRARTNRRVFRIGIPAAAAAGAGALALTLSGGSPVSSADAAILRHVEAALSSPPATILHERAMVTAMGMTAPYELWSLSVPPYSYHVSKWGHSGTGTSNSFDDPAAELRALVAAGGATVVGTTTIDGVAAYKLQVSGATDRFLNGIAYVDRSNYHPLEIDTTGNGGERIVFQTYENLPATAANMRLMRDAGPATAPASARTAAQK